MGITFDNVRSAGFLGTRYPENCAGDQFSGCRLVYEKHIMNEIRTINLKFPGQQNTYGKDQENRFSNRQQMKMHAWGWAETMFRQHRKQCFCMLREQVCIRQGKKKHVFFPWKYALVH